MGHRRYALGAAVMLATIVGGCSSDDSGTSPSVTTIAATTESTAAATTAPPPSAGPSSSAPATTATQPPAATDTTLVTDESTPLSAAELVEALASDVFTGRDEQTDGSFAAQQLLIDQLRQFAEPARAGQPGDGGYLQPIADGDNVVAIIPGTDLADEWIVIGAHYDHLGVAGCPTDDPTDSICNGATDNASGVAVAMAAGRTVAGAGPRRSVLIGLWDREEDGLLGSAAYLAEPLVPLESTVAYLNFDIQGANLLPALATTTVMVGAETGGPPLHDAAIRATQASTLDTLALSLLFGQGRSDHANFIEAGVPSVFFTDANSACYHTTADDIDIVDFAKLDQQIATATALTLDLVATDVVPVFDPAAPPTTFDDAAAMLALVTSANADLALLDPEAQASAAQYRIDLQAIADAGPAAFDETDVGTVLNGAVVLVDALTQGECNGYLPAG